MLSLFRNRTFIPTLQIHSRCRTHFHVGDDITGLESSGQVRTQDMCQGRILNDCSVRRTGTPTRDELPNQATVTLIEGCRCVQSVQSGERSQRRVQGI